ncbi:MAG: SPOR domain-containing protein [Bacteroidales bacterium]
MKQLLLFLGLICLFSAGSFAQSTAGTRGGDVLEDMRAGGPGAPVRMEVDSLIVSQYHRLVFKNMKEDGVPGYRIRIFSESGLGAKEEQRNVRARFLSLYPGIDAYNDYDEPFFKVYVGDCRTRSEALALFDLVQKNFPNPIIVPDHIRLKNTD